MSSNDTTSGKAILWLLFGVMAGLGLDLAAKQVLQAYPLVQFVFLRSLIGLLIFLCIAHRFGGIRALKTEKLHWHLLRTLFSVGAMFGFFYGLQQMPLIDALTLGYTAPLMVTALSAIALGDPVGWRRWSAVSIGFAGVLIMLRPGTEQLSWASLAVLFAALSYACLAITSRSLATTESSLSLSVYVIAGPMVVSGVLSLDGGWVMPDLPGMLLFTVAGACSVMAWIGIVAAYRRAPPAVLAPFEYSALVLGAVAGYLIWDEIPDAWSVAGALVIVGSGVFVAYREMGRPLSARYLRAVTAGIVASMSRRLRKD
ncbi:MAG: DMT family transporter [Pseudomonadota bacterium]